MPRDPGSKASHPTLRDVRARHPPFLDAVLEDARVTAANRGERFKFRSKGDAILQALRLAWASDAFLAQVAYRAKARLQALGVPILPRLAHRFAMSLAQVSIGDPVVVHPGIYLVHGQVVIDGFVEIQTGTVITPFVTIGLRSPDFVGPTIGRRVRIGSGAKIIGPLRIGTGARIGANAVVLDDVPAHTTVVGAPARVVSPTRATGVQRPPDRVVPS